MQFNGVNNKECLHSPGSKRCQHIINYYAHVSEFHVLMDRSVAYVHVQEALTGVFVMAAHCQSSSPPIPSPFPLTFHCFNSVTGACSSCCMGAHGWVAKICQPWEQSSSRSWLPIVEAPGCLPTSILAMQLLMMKFIVNNRTDA